MSRKEVITQIMALDSTIATLTQQKLWCDQHTTTEDITASSSIPYVCVCVCVCVCVLEERGEME